MRFLKMNVKIVVATHKRYWMPSDSMYLPVRAGAALSDDDFGFQRDDAGENISTENPHYSELTPLYWAWKNLDVDYIGLVQYRRQFKGSGERQTLTSREASQLLAQAPVILPKWRNYFISTIEDHYGSTFDSAQIELVRDALAKLAPEYLPNFNARMKSTKAHVFNMFVMRRDILDGYCGWLFPILAEVSRNVDYSGMTPFQARVIGRLSELLLDSWISHNEISYVENPVISMEKVNWLKKGTSFLEAKFFGKKYEESF